jgi:asparagine synthase (glutamine-hydrolysing)
MCGICGIVGERGAGLSTCQRMMDAMAHRGHDGSGSWSDPVAGIALGHRRLAIIDLSSAGAQPMHSHSGRYTITFNGEIYNYRELTSQLKACGVTFTSTSDTELLVAAFEQWGVDCLLKLRGMFAFGLFDHHTNTLICARDPLGIKPLYYYHSPDKKTFLFASEIKGLLASNVVPRVADPLAIAAYHRFYCIPQPQTIINNLFALMPGHYATISLVGGAVDVKTARYFDLVEWSCEGQIASTSEWQGAVSRALFDAVRAHLVADVPVGLFLSGGLDSAALGAIMHQINPARFHTFSIGFGGCSPLDESPIAALVAKKLNTIHHHCVIGAADFHRELPHFIAAIDQPSGDGLNSYFVSRFAAQETKVAFSGLGGDELFLGYRYMQDLRRLFALQQSSIVSLLAQLLTPLTCSPRLLYHLGLKFLSYMGMTDQEIYLAIRSLRQVSTPHDLSALFASHDRLNRFSLAELSFYVPNMLLRDADATSMYSTLELRVPFLDVQLIKLILSLPSSCKPPHKQLLIAAVGDLLPSEILNLPKRGFEMPVGFWIKDTLDNHLERLTTVPALSLKQRSLELAAFRRDPRNYLPVWSSMVLKLWLEHHRIEAIG